MLAQFATKYSYGPRVYLELEVQTAVSFRAVDAEAGTVFRWWQEAKAAAARSTSKWRGIAGLVVVLAYVDDCSDGFDCTVSIIATGHCAADVDSWHMYSRDKTKRSLRQMMAAEKAQLMSYLGREMAATLARQVNILEDELKFAFRATTFAGDGCFAKRLSSVAGKVGGIVEEVNREQAAEAAAAAAAAGR